MKFIRCFESQPKAKCVKLRAQSKITSYLNQEEKETQTWEKPETNLKKTKFLIEKNHPTKNA